MQESFSLGQLLGTLFRRARFLIIGTFLIALAAALISLFLIPRLYLASATLLPEEEESQSSLAALLGQAGLPFMSGLSGGSSAEVQREILGSYSVALAVVEDLDLYGPYDLEKGRAESSLAAAQDAVARLQSDTRVEIDERSGVLRLMVTAPGAELARDIVDRMVAELDAFSRRSQMEAGRRKQAFLDRRLAQAQVELEAARDAIAEFSAREGVVYLPSELEAQLTLVAELNRQLIFKELERAALAQDASEASPQLRRVEAEITLLRDKLAGLERGDEDSALLFKPLDELPELSLRYYALRRELEVQQQIGDLLLQQREQANLQAENDVSTLQLLDPPRVPTLPVWPRKKLIVLGAALFGFALLSLWVLWRDFLVRVRRNERGRWSNWQWLPGGGRSNP